MSQSKTSTWIAATAVLCLAVLLGAYFLLISPTLANASETRERAQAQQDQNATAQVKIAALKKQFENIDGLKADLATLQKQIPTSSDLAEYRRQLDTIAKARGVTVMSVSFSVPAATTTEEPAPAPTTDAAASATDAEAPVVKAAPASTTYAVPMSLDVIGSYEATLAFLQDIQTGTSRLVLVEQITGTGQKATEASPGKPATAEGDLEVQIVGDLYVLPATGEKTPAVDPDAKPEPLAPSNGHNPMLYTVP
jgi:Tfp pilus assembly protein PilO